MNLIVPVAADKSEYEDKMPYIFNLGDDGIMLCIKAILGLNLNSFSNIYFTVLNKHNKLYLLEDLFKLQFKRIGIESKAKVVVLNESTKNQLETIARTIELNDIHGSFMIKDADNYFECEIIPENSVTIFPLDALSSVNPKDKSYVAVDDSYYITNIIEKKIISRYFCAGGYIFEDTAHFMDIYKSFINERKAFLSHIIYKELLEGNVFRPIMVKNYKDWGTKEDWIKLDRNI